MTVVDHPGVFIKDELDARGWDQGDLAFVLGYSEQTIGDLINGEIRLSATIAMALEAALNVNARFFMGLQTMYDLQHAGKPDAAIRIRARWQSKLPLREMIARGWIEDTEADHLDSQMMRFFEVDRMDGAPRTANNKIG